MEFLLFSLYCAFRDAVYVTVNKTPFLEICTTRKRSLGQGNMFTGLCQSFCLQEGSLYNVTSCLSAWPDVPSMGAGLYPGGSLSSGGLCPVEGLCPVGGLCQVGDLCPVRGLCPVEGLCPVGALCPVGVSVQWGQVSV